MVIASSLYTILAYENFQKHSIFWKWVKPILCFWVCLGVYCLVFFALRSVVFCNVLILKKSWSLGIQIFLLLSPSPLSMIPIAFILDHSILSLRSWMNWNCYFVCFMIVSWKIFLDLSPSLLSFFFPYCVDCANDFTMWFFSSVVMLSISFISVWLFLIV